MPRFVDINIFIVSFSGPKSSTFYLQRMTLNYRRDVIEDFYAARIGRIMWRIAKRRAVETQQDAAAPSPNSFENIVALPNAHLGPTKNRGSGQSSLAKFLRELVVELAEDD